MIHRVQVLLTESEFEQIKKDAETKDVSISKYIKDRILPKKEDSFEEIWKEFTERLEKFPVGIEFTVRQIMTDRRWTTFDKSTKLSLARRFQHKRSADKAYSNIELIGRTPANVSIYKKLS